MMPAPAVKVFVDMDKIALCVASNRAPELSEFLHAWKPHLPQGVSLYVHEDHSEIHPLPAVSVAARLVHTSHADIDRILGSRSWIIPKGSGASRSFPMYLAWKDGADFIITTDDDCLPPEQEPDMFFRRHLDAFHLDRWFRTIDGETPRGVPYGDKGRLPVLLNHGLWTGIPDLDGPTALVAQRRPSDVVLRAAREVVPAGMWFSLCAMNVCYHRSAIPAAYNLLMGLETSGFDRFDDIWSGLFLKRIADHLGMFVTNGIPFVRHTKASNRFTNLRKEALGIQLHEDFWKHVAAAPLSAEETVIASYRMLAAWVGKFGKAFPQAPAPPGYFERLSSAMETWADLFS